MRSLGGGGRRALHWEGSGGGDAGSPGAEGARAGRGHRGFAIRLSVPPSFRPSVRPSHLPSFHQLANPSGVCAAAGAGERTGSSVGSVPTMQTPSAGGGEEAGAVHAE